MDKPSNSLFIDKLHRFSNKKLKIMINDRRQRLGKLNNQILKIGAAISKREIEIKTHQMKLSKQDQVFSDFAASIVNFGKMERYMRDLLDNSNMDSNANISWHRHENTFQTVEERLSESELDSEVNGDWSNSSFSVNSVPKCNTITTRLKNTKRQNVSKICSINGDDLNGNSDFTHNELPVINTRVKRRCVKPPIIESESDSEDENNNKKHSKKSRKDQSKNNTTGGGTTCNLCDDLDLVSKKAKKRCNGIYL